MRTLSQNRLNLAGALLTLVLIVGAAVGPLFLADPFATTPADRFQAPSLAHWAGTDNLGRDQLARITLGLRLSILVVDRRGGPRYGAWACRSA